MKPVRVAILLVLVAAVVATVTWRSQWFFMHNKVTFLLNQRRFDEAIQLIESLDRKDLDHPRTVFLQVKALAITGEFRGAVLAAAATRQVPDPEMLYWLALSQHQLGETGAAAETARRFLDSNGRLPAGSQKIVRALAGSEKVLDAPNQDALEFRLLFPIEKAVYLGLAGLHQWQIGRLDTAAQLIRDAFMLENRNPVLLVEGSKALALVGDVQSAQMFWDYANRKSIIALLDDLLRMYQNFQTVSLTLNSDDLARGGRKVDVARAVAWAAGEFAKEQTGTDPTTVTALMDKLLEDYPYDPVLQVRQAALLENIGDIDGAYKLYRDVHLKNPSFMVLVRMLTLQQTSEQEFTQQTAELMQSLNPLAALMPSQLRVENGKINDHFIHFQGHGTTTGTVELEEQGTYMLTVVAKGERAGGKWPLVKVYIDEEPAGLSYISREIWDCYNISIPLEAGPHTIELAYEETDSTSADIVKNRSLYLRSIYLTLRGIANVR